MNDSKLGTIVQVREFLAGTADLALAVPAKEAKRRQFLMRVLRRFSYFRLKKRQRGVLFAYMQRLTGYSPQAARARCRTRHGWRSATGSQ